MSYSFVDSFRAGPGLSSILILLEKKNLFYRYISIKSPIYFKEIRPIEDFTELTMQTNLEKKIELQ